MESKTRKHLLEKVVLFVAVTALLLVVAMPVDAALPPRPPRPPHITPTPAPVSQISNVSAVDGGFIRLAIAVPKPALSAVVQWQDSTGKWHNVNGWRSNLAHISVRWWVNPGDFGKGPFRWVVYEQSQENIIAVSDMFFLPESEQHVVNVYITLQ